MKKLFVIAFFALPVFGQAVDAWTSSAGAGIALTSGNSDTQNVNLSFNTLWDPKTTRTFKADAVYLLGRNDGEKQVDKATANARYEGLFSPRAFWFGEVAYLRDPFKEISYLVSPLAGAGIHVINDASRKLTLDAAAGAVVESSASFGRDTSGALKAGETFDWTISPVSKFTQRLTGLWKADDFGDALYHFDAGLSTTVATRLELKVSYLYDYKNRTPSPDVEKGDSALFAALLVKF